MYITETTENVRKLFEELDGIDCIHKMRFILYVFDLLNNNQINSKNEMNPDLVEDDDLEIFNAEIIGFPIDFFTIFLSYNVAAYNMLMDNKDAYISDGNVIGIKNEEYDNKLSSKFSKLDFKDKLDVIAELMIRYENGTLFDGEISTTSFDDNRSAFDIAKEIKEYKNRI